ncbi:MAG: RnfABCDGE type electron transport complex subunit G [Bacteroidales bacterium]|jgi:electron transport complex protein RnfG|nr:RnfABCDGE type electron transport complex subunit G [Bacteroidales bacterium]
MAKLESTMKNMVMSLTFIALAASALLAGAYVLTKKPIENTAKINQDNAIKEVLPNKQAQVGKPVNINLKGFTDPFVVYPATVNNELIGAAIQTYSNEGYGGTISIMVGLDKEGNISNYSILTSGETPGLGQKAGEWFKANGTKHDIRGKNPGKLKFKPTKDGGDIDAITASTITSRAFLKAVQSAYDAFLQYQKQANNK